MTDELYFPIRGVVEGFYGAYYTFPERDDLIRFIGRHGFNLYIYGPKNDRQHRMRWWEPYPAGIMDRFGRTIAIARDAGVTFCYAISFGVPINYASEDDFRVVTAKLRAFYDRGVRSFAVLMDDITDGLVHDINRVRYRGVAEAHADICNRLYAWLEGLGEPCGLWLCQSEYSGEAPFGPYLVDLGAALHPAIGLFYSGPAICAHAVTVDDVRAFTAAAGRAPIIWDNYPVNDLDMRGEMHLGPVRGRDAALYEVVRGVVVNPMTQAEASKIPLLTYASYLRDPYAYDPERSWQAALLEIGGKDSARAAPAGRGLALFLCGRAGCRAAQAPRQRRPLRAPGGRVRRLQHGGGRARNAPRRDRRSGLSPQKSHGEPGAASQPAPLDRDAGGLDVDGPARPDRSARARGGRAERAGHSHHETHARRPAPDHAPHRRGGAGRPRRVRPRARGARGPARRACRGRLSASARRGDERGVHVGRRTRGKRTMIDHDVTNNADEPMVAEEGAL